MISCSDLLNEYSDYRDDLMTQERSSLVREHLATCESCASYDEVFSRGILELRGLPPVEPSYDFIPRLQHRIYHVDEEAAWHARPHSSAASAGFIALLVIVLGAAAWVPVVGNRPALVELPAVAAVLPASEKPLPRLFQSGPHLEASTVSTLAGGPRNELFFRYTALGSYANLPGSGVHNIRR